MLDSGPEFLTVAEAAAVLRVQKRTLYAAIRKGQIPAIRVGREYRIPRTFLTAIAEKAAQEGAEKTESAPKA